MKKTILLLFLNTSLLVAQTINPKWIKMLRDSSLAPELGILLNPETITIDKEQNIFSLNSYYYGWNVTKINSNTGKVMWQNRRNFKTPTLDSSQYWASDLFLNDTGDIDVLGFKFWVKHPTPLFYINGNAAKATYNFNNGKELGFKTLEHTKGGILLTGYGSSRRFIKRKGGYFILEGNILPGLPFYGWLRKTNSNLSKTDTLHTFISGLEINNYAYEQSAKPILINDKFYYFTKFSKKTDFIYRLHKVDTTGKLIFQKEIFDKFYNSPNATDIEKASDGLLFASFKDTIQVSKKIYAPYIMKLDTNTNLVWRSFLFQPDSINDNWITLSKQIDNKGFWVIGNEYYTKTSCNLYWLENNGKSKYLGKLKIPQYTKERIIVSNIQQLTNNDLLVTFGLTKCIDPDGEICDDTYAGIACFKGEDLEKLLNSKDMNTASTLITKIYPNPTQDMLNISLAEVETGQINLLDLQGQLISTKSFKEQKDIQWILPNLISGIYYVVIHNNNGKSSSSTIYISE